MKRERERKKRNKTCIIKIILTINQPMLHFFSLLVFSVDRKVGSIIVVVLVRWCYGNRMNRFTAAAAAAAVICCSCCSCYSAAIRSSLLILPSTMAITFIFYVTCCSLLSLIWLCLCYWGLPLLAHLRCVWALSLLILNWILLWYH